MIFPHPINQAGRDVQFAEAQRFLAEGDLWSASDVLNGLSEVGDHRAQLMLGKLYLSEGRPQKEARRLISEAASSGDPEAEFLLGELFYLGVGGGRSVRSAFQWYSRSAEAGYPDAMYLLGLCYLEGTGVREDPGTAMAWFERARDLGEPNSAFMIGELYRTGVCGEEDMGMAFDAYVVASTMGNPDAMYRLYQMHSLGLAPSPDPVAGERYRLMAAEQGVEFYDDEEPPFPGADWEDPYA